MQRSWSRDQRTEETRVATGLCDKVACGRMMERPWLSVIIPSYNGNRWFAAALQSVVAQNDRGIEVILVDSSDTDESLAIADDFYSRLAVRTYRRPDLSSWMAKTNFAVEQAKADWICMLHKDDLWLPNRCSKVSEWLAADPASVMHLHSADIIGDAGKRLGTWRCPLPSGGAPVPAPVMLERLLIQNFIAVPTPTIRRAAYLKVAGLDEQLWYTADWDLYLKLLSTGNVYYHADPLACFRVHRDSLTMSGSRNAGDFRSQMETVLDRHIGRLTARHDETRRLALASINVNVALAAAGEGRPAQLIKASTALCALGPQEIFRYFRNSRIIERAYPRLHARIAGGL
jgi:glycosyltransferase involved in cell wall biosynthesis